MSRANSDTAGEDGFVISLVGMSNSGKSYISSKLENELGFERVCVDDLIEQELEPELVKYGYKGIEDMAKWMGQPYESHSARNQAIYLAIESKIMNEIIKRLNGAPPLKNLVIDTTGSVVHTGNKICNELSKISKVVYLSANEDDMEEMFRNFLEKPKPIVWGQVYKRNHNYANHEVALAKFYPKLLRQRSKLYSNMCHVNLPREKLIGISPRDFLDKVQGGLPG